jgi:hypothetical protein
VRHHRLVKDRRPPPRRDACAEQAIGHGLRHHIGGKADDQPVLAEPQAHAVAQWRGAVTPKRLLRVVDVKPVRAGVGH